ncbi:hypothetical protein, partial [uncultured Planktomarina sp.]|uniref:hypothetical protein n=1 Tax=uncultured Planktomarina sp. TaxID=1538529 RepID=UPI0032618C24
QITQKLYAQNDQSVSLVLPALRLCVANRGLLRGLIKSRKSFFAEMFNFLKLVFCILKTGV